MAKLTDHQEQKDEKYVHKNLGVILGSCLYRVIVAIALRFNLPASALKLVSAVIVGIAISIPAIKEILALQKTKRAAMLRHKALYEQQKGGR